VIDLRNIETFFWVASFGSFRAAAEKLNTTQPAVSQRIASLESGLGVRLFERDTRGVTLTGKGQALLSYAERMLDLRRDMVQLAREQNLMRGTVRLGVPETVVQTWLSTLIEQLHAAYPDLALEIDVDTSVVMRTQLLARQLDLAFLLGPVVEPRVENIPLCTYPLAWVARPDLDLGSEPVPLARIAELPVITYPSNSSPYQTVRTLLAGTGARLPRMYGCASLSMAVKMTLDGIGTSVITPVFLDRELASGALRLIRVQAPQLPALAFTASWLQGPDSVIAETIAHIARRVAKQHGTGSTPPHK